MNPHRPLQTPSRILAASLAAALILNAGPLPLALAASGQQRTVRAAGTLRAAPISASLGRRMMGSLSTFSNKTFGTNFRSAAPLAAAAVAPAAQAESPASPSNAAQTSASAIGSLGTIGRDARQLAPDASENDLRASAGRRFDASGAGDGSREAVLIAGPPAEPSVGGLRRFSGAGASAKGAVKAPVIERVASFFERYWRPLALASLAGYLGLNWLNGQPADGWSLASLGGMLGTVLPSPGGGEPPAPAELTEAGAIEAFKNLNERILLAEPGGIVKNVDLDAAQELAGIDKKGLDRVMDKLVSIGVLIKLENGSYIYSTAYERRNNAQEVGVRTQADSHFLIGARLMNDAFNRKDVGRMENYEMAMVNFQLAYQKYSRDKDPNAVLLMDEADNMQRNAAIQLAGSFLKRWTQMVKDKPLKDKKKEAEFFASSHELQQWLDSAVYSVGAAPAKMTAQAWERLSKIALLMREGAGTPEQLRRALLFESSTRDFPHETAPAERTVYLLKKSGKVSGTVASGVPAVIDSPPAQNLAGYPLIAEHDKSFKALNTYGTNLTALAAAGKLDPLVGLEDKVQAIRTSLARRTKNNPLIIGDPGVGKTALVEGFVQRLVAGDFPEHYGKNVFFLDVNALQAGTRLRGDFEERVDNVLREIERSNGKVILWIDEIQGLSGAGGLESGQSPLIDALKVRLTKPASHLSIIGATTYDDAKAIEKNKALKRRFQLIHLDPPDVESAIKIIDGSKKLYEAKHKIEIPSSVVEQAVRAAGRYITDSKLPDSALDLIDDAGARLNVLAIDAERAKQPSSRVMTDDHVFLALNRRTGIPVQKLGDDQAKRLLELPDRLKRRVIGQDEAVEATSEIVQDGLAGFGDRKKPIGSLIYLGPTGVGKTELARALAEDLFDDENALVRIDMSEYQEKFTVARLIGAPPGYVGHEEAGALTEPVRRRPYQVVLFDEIEKAHPDIFNVLLQVLDDGFLTDSLGRRVDFKNTVIIMTSNIGSEREFKQALGFQKEEDEEEKHQKRTDRHVGDLKKSVRPEFYNRIGKVVVFRKLDNGQITEILPIVMKELQKDIASKRLTVALSDEAKEKIFAATFTKENAAYGARPLKRNVGPVRHALTLAFLRGEIKEGDKVLVDVVDGKFVALKDPR